MTTAPLTQTKPAPYPPDTKAKGWRFEVDMEKVESSDTWLRAKTGAVRGALLLLWAKSWQQVPCGSLPNDHELVALLIDMPDSTFAKHRSVLMRGWWLAEDGRLYHDTITTRVLVMLEKRASDAVRAANRRAKLLDSQPGHAQLTPESRVTNTGLRSEFDTKHQAPSTSTGEDNTPKAPRKRRAPAASQQVVSLDQLKAEGVSEQHATDWLTVRAKKSLPLTPTAWDEVKAQAVLAGVSNDEAVRMAAANGWGGFKHKWLSEPSASVRPSTTGGNKQEAREQRNRAVADEWAAEGATT